MEFDLIKEMASALRAKRNRKRWYKVVTTELVHVVRTAQKPPMIVKFES